MFRVVIKKPGFRPYIKEVDAGLDSMQALVEGYIEVAIRAPNFFGGGDELVIYCNEEGLLKQLPLNFYRTTDGHPIVGTVVAVKTDSSGEDVSMTFEDGEKVRSLIDKWRLPTDKEPDE